MFTSAYKFSTHNTVMMWLSSVCSQHPYYVLQTVKKKKRICHVLLSTYCISSQLSAHISFTDSQQCITLYVTGWWCYEITYWIRLSWHGCVWIVKLNWCNAARSRDSKMSLRGLWSCTFAKNTEHSFTGRLGGGGLKEKQQESSWLCGRENTIKCPLGCNSSV